MKPFLDRLAKHLPAPRYKLIPMYSMSTETIETLPNFRGEDVAFLPIAAGVVYEFIEETALDRCRQSPESSPARARQTLCNGGQRRLRFAALSNRRSLSLQTKAKRPARSRFCSASQSRVFIYRREVNRRTTHDSFRTTPRDVPVATRRIDFLRACQLSAQFLITN